MTFYAVHIGKTPGIYKTWGECQEQVKGFSGAKYKKFIKSLFLIGFICDNSLLKL